jgi:hypothetical protein
MVAGHLNAGSALQLCLGWRKHRFGAWRPPTAGDEHGHQSTKAYPNSQPHVFAGHLTLAFRYSLRFALEKRHYSRPLTINTGLLALRAKAIECAVPRDCPSQNATNRSHVWTIWLFRMNPAFRPCLFQSGKNTSNAIPFNVASLSAAASTPRAPPLTTVVSLGRLDTYSPTRSISQKPREPTMATFTVRSYTESRGNSANAPHPFDAQTKRCNRGRLRTLRGSAASRNLLRST